jgi:GT2 family glycosyltransferase
MARWLLQPVVPGEETVFLKMTVAAVVPHWNRRALLRSLLESLRGQTRQFDEIIVADNGSTDGSAEFAEKSGARVVRLDSNLGFAAAVNRGIEAATADWIAILNNDVILDPHWLEKISAAAVRENAWFATGKILSASEPETAAGPQTIDGTFDAISRGACAWRCGAGQPDSPLWNRARRIRFAPMTAALFRRDLFTTIGPLDESFGSYLEDMDFGLRCALAGSDGIYEPSAVARHRGSATLGAWTSDTVSYIARNQILLTVKYFRGQPRWPIVAGQLLWGLLALRHGKGCAYLRGKLSGLRFGRKLPLDRSDTRLERRVRAIVEASEREIFDLQQQTGFDRYWRAYFWLLR